MMMMMMMMMIIIIIYNSGVPVYTYCTHNFEHFIVPHHLCHNTSSHHYIN